MENTIKHLQDLNWFIRPIADFILFLFTTKFGITLLITALVIYIIASIISAIQEKRSGSANGVSYSNKRISTIEMAYISFRVIGNTFLNIISKAPVLIATMLILFMIVGFSSAINTVDQFITNEKKIKELRVVLKHLNQRYKVAEFEVIDQQYLAPINNVNTTLKFQFFDYAETGVKPEPQTMTIKGNDIYFDALVMNFEYSEITSGENKNLTFPLKIFSNAVSRQEGIDLNFFDKDSVPYIFHRSEQEVVGISSLNFASRLKEILSWVKDEKAAKNAGIRSIYGNAVHVVVGKGSKNTVWIEQTGGLVIKSSEAF